MIDIFGDSCDGLELDRAKSQIRDIWNKIIVAEYNELYGHMKDDHDDYVSLEQYIQENQLFFPGDDKPESETENIIEMLEKMFDPQEELNPVSSEGKAPTYNGEQLKSHNEKGAVEATTYEVKYASTKTPKDSKSAVKSGTYNEPSKGKLTKRTDSEVRRSYRPMVDKIVEDLLSLDQRRRAGYAERRQRL